MPINSVEILKIIDERETCDTSVLKWDEVVVKCN